MTHQELISKLEQICIDGEGFSQRSRNVLIDFKNFGGTQQTAKELVSELAKKYEENEIIQDQVYDVLDLITRYTSPNFWIWIAPYINFHTHLTKPKEGFFEIESIHFGETIKSDFFTLGRHPWWTEKLLTFDEKQDFLKLAKQENCLGIGEIGLDKLKGVSIEIQKEIFRELLQIAQNVNKPVIIHCVRSFDTLIQLKKEFPKIKNWCIHGFSRNTELAKQLIKNGFYISIFSTQDITKKHTDLIKYLPLDKIFIETDDSNIEIESIYKQISTIKDIDIIILKEQIKSNFEYFFDLNSFF